MPSITLKYSSTSFTISNALSVKGFLPTDGHTVFPELYPIYLNGSKRSKKAGFRRLFTIDLGIITTAATLESIGLFLNSNEQYIGSYTYTGIGGTVTEVDVRVVDRHPEFESVWEGGVEIGRRVVLNMEEADLRVGWPSATGYGASYGSAYGTGL
jgi:hypothetical protein